MGLSFTTVAGPRQRSHSRLRVPQESWPHFTVSDSRLPQPRGPGTRICIPQEQGGPVIPQELGSLYVAPYNLQGYGGGILTHLHTGVFFLAAWDPRYIALGWNHRKHCLLTIVPLLGLVAETCLPSSCSLETYDFTILAFGCHVRVLSEPT
jgi:hypothetical protein